jgi:hypothetical protein
MRNYIDVMYFAIGDSGICGDDFKNKPEKIAIRVDSIMSLSGLMRFTLPFSGTFVDSYAVLTVVSGEKYYISEGQYNIIRNLIEND